MLKITFKPETDKFTPAAEEYTAIWRAESVHITSAIEHAANLPFKEKAIEAIVYEGRSRSDPILKLRASYDQSTKKATLIHELLHRLSDKYRLDLPVKGDELSLGLHKQIDLLLYDIWIELYGQKFADDQVKIESARTPKYKEAWNWTLSFSRDERQQKFATLRQRVRA